MKVEVRYFAAYREATGVSSEAVETTAATAADLFAQCAARHAGLSKFTASLVAVNDEMTDWSRTLDNGDTVLFFPPVAGG